MRTKILFIIPTLDRCGAEKQLTLLATNLPRDEFEVKVVVLTRDGPYSEELRAAGIPVVVIGKKCKLSLGAYFKLKREIKRFKPDIVHTWIFAANAYGRKAAFACRVPVVICGERCLDPWKAPWQNWIDAKLEPKTDVYAVNSQGIVDFYVERGIPKEKFAVIYNAVEVPPTPTESKEELKKRLLDELGVDYSSPENVASEKDRFFRSLHITNEENVGGASSLPKLIGLVARLWPQKRVKDALWIADQVKFAGVNFYLLIIGDGPERESLLRYREDLRLKNRVLFLGERNDVARFTPCFDLLWNCSAYEGQSNAILEAQSYGVPVLASDVAGNRDLVISGQTGVLVPEFEGDRTRRRTAFARETCKLLAEKNKDELERLGNEARKRTREVFSLEAMVAQYAALYKRTLEKKRRSVKAR